MWYRHPLYQQADYVAHHPSSFIPSHTHFFESISLTIVVDTGVS